MDVEEISNTIYIDAQSFLYVAYKNNFTASTSITQTRHLLLTDNVSLAIVAKKLCKNPRDIPICASDAFFGAMIWKNSPAELADQSRRTLSNFIYQAFLPTDNLSARMREIIEESVEAGDLSEDEAVVLKQNKIAASLLVSVTEADITKVSKDTQYEIIRRIKKEQREIGAKEVEEKYLPIVEEKDSIINKANQKNHELQTELLGEKIRRCNSDKISLDKEIETMRNVRQTITQRVNTRFKIIGVCVAIFSIVIFVVGVCISLLVDISPKISNLFMILGIVLAILPWIVAFVVGCFATKSTNLTEIFSKIKNSTIKKKYEQQNCTDSELKTLTDKCDLLTEELEGYKREQDTHYFSRAK